MTSMNIAFKADLSVFLDAIASLLYDGSMRVSKVSNCQ